jgi:hypothetical protein
MSATAATATTLAILAVLYAIECWWWPYAKCGKCEGVAKSFGPDGKHFRLCPRCNGSGRRLRPGRRVWNFLRDKTSGA